MMRKSIFRFQKINFHGLINQENNENKIVKKAKNLRIKYINNNLPESIKKRCVNFMQLEQFLNENMIIDSKY